MNPYELANQLKTTGFATEVRCGYYDQPKQPITRTVKVLLNLTIRSLGKYGLYVAPFYALLATK
jgi:hypothetical protein